MSVYWIEWLYADTSKFVITQLRHQSTGKSEYHFSCKADRGTDYILAWLEAVKNRLLKVSQNPQEKTWIRVIIL